MCTRNVLELAVCKRAPNCLLVGYPSPVRRVQKTPSAFRRFLGFLEVSCLLLFNSQSLRQATHGSEGSVSRGGRPPDPIHIQSRHTPDWISELPSLGRGFEIHPEIHPIHIQSRHTPDWIRPWAKRFRHQNPPPACHPHCPNKAIG